MCNIPEAVKEYIEIVKSEEYPVCREQKQLVSFVEKVLAEESVYFDEEQLEKYLSYQKYFPFKLFPWEKFVFALHNCLYKAPGILRFPHAFICVGRGAGKTGYSSFENFCLLTPTNGVKKYDIYTFAMSEDQAKTAWQDMYEILEGNPTLFKKFFKWTKEVITNTQTGSSWYYCTSSPKTKDGQRPGKVDFDEYHAYEGYKLINVAITGLGKKPMPRETITTTNAAERGLPFEDMFSRSLQILEGEAEDAGLLPFITRLDSPDEVSDKRMWHKANPTLRYFPHLQAQLELEYCTYVINPVVAVDFMAKRMNLPPMHLENEAVSFEMLKKASRDFDKEIVKGRKCVAGIDFASTTDMVGAGLLFRIDNIDYWIYHAWVCEGSKDLPGIKVPLREWAVMGELSFVSGAEIHPDLVSCWLMNTAAALDATILCLGIDRYRYTLLSKSLLNCMNFSTEKHYENVRLVHASDEMKNIPRITAAFAGERIVWGDSPLMRWSGNNTKIDITKSGNMTYQKIEPHYRKNDPFKAFAAAECVSDILDEYDGEDLTDEFIGVYTY